ncbi:MAG: hypothetical protein GX879_11340 [Bacteroidales bacterium]|nr:hypothetical protein [Bacteroidales bacterium]
MSKILFISPKVSAYEACTLVRNYNSDGAAINLAARLEKEFKNDVSAEKGIDFIDKLKLWVEVHGFPNLNEIKEVTTEEFNLATEEWLIFNLKVIAFTVKLPKAKLKFFLNHYHSFLDEKEIDKILDKYLDYQEV